MTPDIKIDWLDPFIQRLSDLPVYAGDTWILQGSPTHPLRIVSHLHLARLYMSTVLSIDLFC